MTFTHDLAEFVNMYSRMRREEGDPLCMPEALEGLCQILLATIRQPSVSEELRADLLSAVHIALDMHADTRPKGRVN